MLLKQNNSLNRKYLLYRPAIDDFTLLKRELVQVQQLTDTILREKENEHKLLIREQKELTQRLEKCYSLF